MHPRVVVELVEQALQLLQRGIVLAAGVNDVLQIGQPDILEGFRVQGTAHLEGGFIAVYVGFGYGLELFL